MSLKFLFCLFICLLPVFYTLTHGEKSVPDVASPTIENAIRPEVVGGTTNDATVRVEEESISADGFSVAEMKLLQQRSEKHAFQAEINSLMKIIINSLYSNSEIFLREVISNASDAIDKIRYLSLQDKTVLNSNDKLEIRIKADPERNALHITDTGVGMTKKDLIENLGTIAQSGTSQFLQHFKEAGGDLSLIGQFGVGFYSVFLVADEVTVTTKHNDDKQYVWKSDSQGTFTVAEDPRGDTLGRGTQITLHLKEDALDFSKPETLKALIQKYSQFINYPIYLWNSSEDTRDVPLTPEEIEQKKQELRDKKKSDDDEEVVSLDEEKPAEIDESEIPTTKSVTETLWNWEQINTVKPVWMRPVKDVSEQEYKDFYHTLTKDPNDPLHFNHFNAEGEVNFKSVLYIPSAPPQNMWDPAYDLHKGIKLYVRRVFITDEFQDILPKYLGFIRGLVDSDDLPLNVSREMLQEHKLLKIIKKKLTRKAIAMIQELADSIKPQTNEDGTTTEVDETKKKQFDDFYNKYHTNVKLGIIEDVANRTRLSKLLRFYSTKSRTEMTTFDDYVGRMKEGQKDIYYLAGQSREVIEQSPLLERLEAKGFEVFFCSDAIDEYALTHLDKFDGKYKIINISREGLKLDDDEDKIKDDKERFQPLTDYLKRVLSDKIDKATPSRRLTTSPSALVAGSTGITANMERIMKAQAITGQNAGYLKKTLEYNTRHPIVKELLTRVQANENEAANKDIALLLYDTAALTSGFNVEDPKEFASHINRLLAVNLGLDPSARAEVEVESDNTETNNKNKETDSKDEL